MEKDENEIKQTEPEKVENKKEETKNENILKQYEDLSPIDLVDTFERYYHTFLPSFDKDSLRILSSYKSKTNVKFQLLFFDSKKKFVIYIKTQNKKYNLFKNKRT